MLLSSMLMIYVVSLYAPYVSSRLNKLQIFFDVVLFLLGDFLMAFNGGGWLDDEK